MRRIGKFIGLAALLAAPLAAHVAVVTHRGTGFAGLLIAVQAALVGWVAVSLATSDAIFRHPVRWRVIRLTICAALFGLAVLIWRSAGDGLMLAAAVPHAMAYLGLLTLFAASLAPGREAIITIVAQRARGTLSDELLAYTRQVTIAWCCFFAAQLVASLLLWLLAPLAWWSVFVNLCTLPLVVLMFGAELAYRHWRHGIHQPAAQMGRWRHALQVVGQIRLPVRRAEP